MRRTGVILIVALVLAAAWESWAQRPTEYEVKAAFLFNFAKFTEWPDSAFADTHAPLLIGVVGSDPFGPILDRTVAGKTVGGRRFVVRRFAKPSDGLHDCHVLFIGSSAAESISSSLAALQEAPVLTVGESDRFCENGGIINLVLRQNRVRFQISPKAADRAGLGLSSRLLRLAEIVPTQEPESNATE